MKPSTIKTVLREMADPNPAKEVLTHALGLSALVYFSNEFIQKSLDALGMPYKILEYKGMKCLIGETNDTIYIAFRGTDTSKWSNWKRILNVVPKKFVNGLYVHGGFELYFKEYVEYLDSYINSIDKPKKIIFTGHSLGAALASLYNIYYTKKSGTVNFACPNFLFNQQFITDDSDSYRIMKDFVTWIPFSLPLLKWYRSFSTIKVKSYKNYINPVSYHSLENYIKSIMT